MATISIRTKLAAPLILIVGAFVAFQLLYFPTQIRQHTTDGLKAKAVSMAGLIAHGVAPAIEFGDDKLARKFLDGAANDEDLLFAFVYNGDNERLASYVRQGVEVEPMVRELPPATYVEASQGRMLVHAPIPTRAGKRGRLTLGLRTTTIESALSEAQRTSVTVGATVFVLGIAFALWIGISIGNRLRTLAYVADAAAAGHLDKEPPPARGGDEVAQATESFRTMLRHLRTVEAFVGEVARGDLTQTLSVPGDLPRAINAMVREQAALVHRIADMSRLLDVSAREILDGVGMQDRAARDQTRVVTDASGSVREFLESAQTVSKTSAGVVDLAERTHATNKTVAEQMARLADHAQGVSEVLEIIKDIANKSEVLALNAALEGTKAGEAGRGFSTVARQMQRLAENVMEAVRQVRALTANIADATQDSARATAQGTSLGAETTEAARRIDDIAGAQRRRAEGMSETVRDMNQLAESVADGSRTILEAVRELRTRSERMQEHVAQFRLSAGAGAGGAGARRS